MTRNTGTTYGRDGEEEKTKVRGEREKETRVSEGRKSGRGKRRRRGSQDERNTMVRIGS